MQRLIDERLARNYVELVNHIWFSLAIQIMNSAASNLVAEEEMLRPVWSCG